MVLCDTGGPSSYILIPNLQIESLISKPHTAPTAVLCDNGRLNEITNVITDYSALMRAHRKEIEVLAD